MIGISMKGAIPRAAAIGALLAGAVRAQVFSEEAEEARRQPIHDWNRPPPAIVDPGAAGSEAQPGKPPADAVVLFDGQDLSQWRASDGGPAKWIVKDGHIESVAKSGPIRTHQAFGDCQLHLEWATPRPAQGTGQGRGNSGVFLMNTYEVQVLDSHENLTYADGQAAAIYGQYPPQVNASRPPGIWQSYDIVFHRPHFAPDGTLKQPARITVFHNGVLVQDNVEILGPNPWMNRPAYSMHADKMALALQDHGNPVHFRNIWIRELPAGRPGDKMMAPAPGILDRYVGEYRNERGGAITISRTREQLVARVLGNPEDWIYARSDTEFFSKRAGISLIFSDIEDGKAQTLTWQHGADRRPLKRAKP